MGARILLVDEDPDSRAQLNTLLNCDGYDVVAVQSQQFSQALKANNVQAALLDASRPTVNEMLRKIRTQYSRTQLPVVVLSENYATGHKVEAMALGANDILAKPVEYDFLVAKLQQLVPQERLQVHELVSGTTLGHFRLDRLIGQGGMGRVFAATDLKLRRQVAIKVVSPTSDPAARERFLREGRAVAQVSHPNVVNIYDIQEEPLPYIVMEMIQGRTLDAIGQLSDSEIHNIIKGVCKALKATHQRGILHRDLKPSNIMVSQEGEVKVMDFGLAKFSSETDGLTDSGEILGTPYYLSPEHFDAVFGDVDQRSDLFAVGSILYELITGTIAFGELGVSNVMFSIISKDIVLPDNCHPLLAQICLKALEKEQSARYRSAQEMLDDLDQVAP
jgi:serine/threonine protein kinase